MMVLVMATASSSATSALRQSPTSSSSSSSSSSSLWTTVSSRVSARATCCQHYLSLTTALPWSCIFAARGESQAIRLVWKPTMKTYKLAHSLVNDRFSRRWSLMRATPRCMAPDEEKMTKRSPLDFPVEWDRPSPGRRADIFPQFSPMKTPLPQPLPADPPEEDEEEEEKKEEEEEETEKEPEKPEE